MSETEKTVEQRVRDRAYAIWEKNGKPEGVHEEDWHQAQTEVEAEDAEPASREA